VALTTGQLAQALYLELHGDADRTLARINDLRKAGEGDLSFLASARFLPFLRQTSASAVIVRAAREGEKFVSLDGVDHELNPPMLTIADSQDPVGLAGVMGGANSEMTDDTTSVLLESANFSPINTRRTRNALDMNTEASYRFERGIRAALAPIALRRATKLMLELCGGQAAKGIIDLYPTDREPPVVSISRRRIRQVLGVDYTTSQIEKTLTSLGFEKAKEPGGLIDLIEAVEAAPAAERNNTLWMKVPYWRSDITIEDDHDRAGKQAEIRAAADAVDDGTGVVVVTDMFGGSPSNLSLMACEARDREIIYGANLPLLIKLAKSRSLAVHAAVEAALDAGRKYINSYNAQAGVVKCP